MAWCGGGARRTGGSGTGCGVSKSWCKVSASLDTHPKIRKAGNLGRQVFEFALRRNAELDLGGFIPSSHMESWYLADVLMLSGHDRDTSGQDQATAGLSRAVQAGLLASVDGGYEIVGWDDEWSKQPKTEAERKRSQRARSRNNTEHQQESRDVTNLSGHDRDCPDSHTREEKREEERESVSRAIQAPDQTVPGAKYDPDSADDRRRLAERLYLRVDSARSEISQRRGKSPPIPFPKITPSSVPPMYRDLADRVREEGADAASVCPQIIEHMIAEADRTGEMTFLGAKGFKSGSWNHARERLPNGQRERYPPSGGRAKRYASTDDDLDIGQDPRAT